MFIENIIMFSNFILLKIMLLKEPKPVLIQPTKENLTLGFVL